MHDAKNETRTMSLQVTDDLTVTIIPNSDHEFLMPTEQVAHGYGSSYDSVRRTKARHEDELISSETAARRQAM